jgi:glucose-6-phosphate-specific signal transduction histidine kinase
MKFSRYWTGEASATDIKAFVWDDPDILFSIEDDGVGDYLTQADIGSTGDHIAGTANDVTGISGAMLDTSTVGTDAGFRVVELVPRVGNAFGTGNGQKCEVAVLINEHLYAR